MVRLLIEYKSDKECEYIQKSLFKNGYTWKSGHIRVKNIRYNGVLSLDKKCKKFQHFMTIINFKCYYSQAKYNIINVKHLMSQEKLKRISEE